MIHHAIPSSCSYCGTSLAGKSLSGRPREDSSCRSYCCYGCLNLGENHSPHNSRGLGIRLAIGILVVGQSMIFGLALNLHEDVPESVRWWVQSFMLMGTLVVAILLSGPLLRAAWQAIRQREPTIELLFVLTMFGAFAASLQAHITERGHIYFEVVSVLLVVYNLGKIIGSRVRAGAIDRSRQWLTRLANCRRIDDSGGSHDCPVSEVESGDRVEVRPGELIPIDGVIREGTGLVSEADITGEPFPIFRQPGDRVLAGIISHDGTFLVEATTPGRSRQVDQLLAAIESFQLAPRLFAKQTEQLAKLFLPVVALIALGTFLYWAFFSGKGFETGLFNAMSVLLVACPCAIGLATPIITWATLGRLAERGLIVHGSDTIEKLAAIDRVILDKTGTLSENHLEIVELFVDEKRFDRAQLLGWVALIEAHSDHPVARPFAELGHPFESGHEARLHSIVNVPGHGIEGVIEEVDGDRHRIRIGSPDWIARYISRPVSLELGQLGRRVEISVDDRLAAAAIIAEKFRDSVPDMLAEFQHMQLPVEILTGDRSEPGQFKLPVQGIRTGLLPGDKLAHIEEVKARGGKPLVVGDGVNDAAALANGYVSVALASGTDLAVDAAAITLYHGNLRTLPWAVRICRQAVTAIRVNIARAVAYNLIGMALAAAGLLHPVVAVVLMGFSSLSLIFSASRLSSRTHCELRDDVQASKISKISSLLLVRAGLHALAMLIQGLLLIWFWQVANEIAIPLAGLVFLAAILLAGIWSLWQSIPHTLDMVFGMLTLGNLGMLVGAWVDRGFSPSASCECCCHEAVAVWMWVGMLGFANVAMLWLGRRPLVWRSNHAAGMLTGGNVGMVAGMIAGGDWFLRLEAGVSLPSYISEFIGMTIGMILGMLVGTRLVELLLALRGSPSPPDDRSRNMVE